MSEPYLLVDGEELVMIFTSENVPLITESGKRGLIYDANDENNVIVNPGNLDDLKERLAESGTEFLVAGDAEAIGVKFGQWNDLPRGVR